jgi:hypothetical protein
MNLSKKVNKYRLLFSAISLVPFSSGCFTHALPFVQEPGLQFIE